MAGLFWCRSLHTVSRVRQHIPLIHFPKRFPKESSTLSGKPNTIASETNISSKHKSNINHIGAVNELPTKYRRRVILPEEILYIERGGPD